MGSNLDKRLTVMVPAYNERVRPAAAGVARKATGQVIEKQGKRGRTFALRFRCRAQVRNARHR